MIEANSGTGSSAAVFNDASGMARLRRDAAAPSPETMRKVAQQFEALFIQMMLKNMRNTGVGDELFGSDQEKLYRDMFDQQLSVDLSEKGALGLSDLLVRQLTRQPGAGADASASTIGNTPAAHAHTVLPASPSLSVSLPPHLKPGVATMTTPVPERVAVPAEPAIETPEDFIRVLTPHAENAARELGVSPRVLLAQAALETGWGRHVMRGADGDSSHNLFGIKADARWSGDRVVSETLEYEDGVAVKRREVFRAYASYEDSFADYAAFLRASPRYGAALAEGADGAVYLQRLQQAGYATDPEYASKIGRIAFGAGSPLGEGSFKEASVGSLTDSDEVVL
ncbi:MAG: flagellar assembly peptidoglycan hydrolase FlgJ [Gammaproteobacteria bacterium]|nr:flagellar assembly peptidoglycan hydrolase FlgJ [Gammaproteobacteria bacterium]